MELPGNSAPSSDDGTCSNRSFQKPLSGSLDPFYKYLKSRGRKLSWSLFKIGNQDLTQIGNLQTYRQKLLSLSKEIVGIAII